MNFLAPAAFAALALSIPVLVLYMLKSRRRVLEVPSIRLWSGEDQFVASAIPWQRLRITSLLVVQLLAIAVFALLLARPFFRQETLLGPHTVLVIDTSGSMAMGDRFEAARRSAFDLVADATDENLVSIVTAGPQPRVLAAFSRDPAALRSAVEGMAVTGGSDDMNGALRLARGLATPDRPTSLLILSDGGVTVPIDEPVRDARHLVFDDTGSNVAIAGFGSSPGEGDTRLFVEVVNHGEQPADVDVEFLVDGLPSRVETLRLDPLSAGRRVVRIDAGPGQVVTARLVHGGDALPLDDAASIVLEGGAGIAVSVLGEGSVFLEALLSSLPGVSPAVGVPPDLVVIDGASAATIDRPAWLIAPSSPPPGVTFAGRIENPVVTFQRPGEPILDGLDLSNLAIAEAQIVVAAEWLPLVRAGDVPLILLGEVSGRRVAYFTFDIARSNLPVEVTFPILGQRIMDWLGGGRAAVAGSAPAGTPIDLAPPAGTVPEVVLPDGSVQRLVEGARSFAATGTPGLYRVNYVAADGTRSPGPTAVRQFVAAESAGLTRPIGTVAPDFVVGDTGSLEREWFPWIIGTLLAVVAFEWWLAYGRPVPRRRAVAA